MLPSSKLNVAKMWARQARGISLQVATRKENEKRFKNWDEISTGGRRYWYDRKGAVSGFQRIIKIVDVDETTLQLLQEIYDDEGNLIERHQKFPIDTGHEELGKQE